MGSARQAHRERADNSTVATQVGRRRPELGPNVGHTRRELDRGWTEVFRRERRKGSVSRGQTCQEGTVPGGSALPCSLGRLRPTSPEKSSKSRQVLRDVCRILAKSRPSVASNGSEQMLVKVGQRRPRFYKHIDTVSRSCAKLSPKSANVGRILVNAGQHRFGIGALD